MICICLVILNVITKLYSTEIDWCSTKNDCVINGVVHKHTLCTKVPGVQEYGNITKQVNVASRLLILMAHNVNRNRMAQGINSKWPEGANIRQLTWDYTLEELATKWAMRCTTEHDVCRKTTEHPDTGQSIGMISFKAENPDEPSLQLMWKWVQTQNLVNNKELNNLVQRYTNGSWDFGTQIIWAETTKMGCGEANCVKVNAKPPQHFRFLVCNYSPAGNRPNKSVYKIGKSCTSCPKGTACNKASIYPSLCAAPGDPKDKYVPRKPTRPTTPRPTLPPRPNTTHVTPTGTSFTIDLGRSTAMWSRMSKCPLLLLGVTLLPKLL